MQRWNKACVCVCAAKANTGECSVNRQLFTLTMCEEEILFNISHSPPPLIAFSFAALLKAKLNFQLGLQRRTTINIAVLSTSSENFR